MSAIAQCARMMDMRAIYPDVAMKVDMRAIKRDDEHVCAGWCGAENDNAERA